MVTTDYFLAATSINFNAIATGTNAIVILVDNSVRFGNEPARVVKLKVQSWWDFDVVDERWMIMAVYRDKEGATPLDLANEAEVRNATQAGQFYRRPFVTHTNASVAGAGGEMDHFRKPLILKNILLDRDDDLVFGYTMDDSAFSGSTQRLQFRSECWFKRV